MLYFFLLNVDSFFSFFFLKGGCTCTCGTPPPPGYGLAMSKEIKSLWPQLYNRFLAYFGLYEVSSSSTSSSLAFSSLRSIRTVFSSFIVNLGRSGSFKSMTILPIILRVSSIPPMFSPCSSGPSCSLTGGAPGGNWDVEYEMSISLWTVVSSSS